jgi:hypothetical protein
MEISLAVSMLLSSSTTTISRRVVSLFSPGTGGLLDFIGKTPAHRNEISELVRKA